MARGGVAAGACGSLRMTRTADRHGPRRRLRPASGPGDMLRHGMLRCGMISSQRSGAGLSGTVVLFCIVRRGPVLPVLRGGLSRGWRRGEGAGGLPASAGVEGRPSVPGCACPAPARRLGSQDPCRHGSLVFNFAGRQLLMWECLVTGRHELQPTPGGRHCTRAVARAHDVAVCDESKLNSL